jgi:hypothetical protein
MANTLTDITPVLYEALDVVSRELIGFIPAVARDSSAERAAVGESVKYHQVPAISLEDVSPGAAPADSGDQIISAGTMTISRSKVAPVRWTGEEQRLLMTGDRPQYRNIVRDQFAQAFRSLSNAVEADLASLYKDAARAYGTAATTPFGTANDFSDAAQIFAILNDKGAPVADRSLVLSNLAAANLKGKQPGLFHVNEAGTSETLRDGKIGRLQGFNLYESGQVASHTAGTAASATVNNAGYAAGSTTLTLSSAGTGTILQGDVLNFAGENNGLKYVVGTGDADVSNGGTVVLNGSGIKYAMSAATKAITVSGNYSANMAFARSAIQLVTRTPAMPEGGDDADDVMNITDPVSGLVFQVAVYRQYRRVKYEIGLAWGYEMVKPDHAVILLG